MTSHPSADAKALDCGSYVSLEETTDFDYDSLLENIQSGHFGGMPHLGPGPVALVEALRCLRWQIDTRTFANAFPHYSAVFGSNEVRAVLARLGLPTEAMQLRGRHLAELPKGSMILYRGAILFVFKHLSGQMQLRNPATGKHTLIRHSRRYECFAVVSAPETSTVLPTGSFAFSLWSRFRPELRVILLLTLLSNVLLLGASFAVGFIFDVVLPAKALDTLAALMVGGIVLIALDLSLRKIKSQVVAYISGRLEYLVSGSLYSKLLDLPLEMTTSVSVGDQVSRLKQFETVRDVFCGPVVMIAFELPFIAIMVAVICFINPTLGVVLLAIVGAHVGIGGWFYPRIKQATLDHSRCRAEYIGSLEETLSHRAQIVRRGLGQMWNRRLSSHYARALGARVRVDDLVRFLTNVNTASLPVALGCVTAVGAVKVMHGEMTGGELIACTILVGRLLGPVQQGILVAVRLPEVANLFRQMSSMLMLPSASKTGNQQRLLRAANQVTLENVVMRYPRAVEPALYGVTVTIESGTFTCVSGPSGAGKSSLLQAIIGHYRLQRGGVYFGPVNAEQLTSHERAQIIGHLGHRTLRLHGTIKQNLHLCAPDATDADLWKICEEVGISGVIQALPGRLDYRLDYAARARFSGTFWTSLALAQVLLRRPQILLLDEPEAGLTPEDEATLLRIVEKRRGQTTILMVTHRPSTMQRADKVMVLQSGRVHFYGPPEKLGA